MLFDRPSSVYPFQWKALILLLLFGGALGLWSFYPSETPNQNILALIAQAKKESNQGLAVELAERAILEAESIGNKELTALAMLEAGKAWKVFGDLVKAETRLLQALDLFHSLGDIHHKHITYNYLGETYRAARSYTESMRYLELARVYFNEQEDSHQLAHVYNRMAASYLEDAFFYVSEDAKMSNLKDSLKVNFEELLQIMPIYQMKTDSLYHLLEQSDGYAQYNNNTEILISNRIIRAAFKNLVRQYEHAKEELYRTLDLIEASGETADLPLLYWNLGSVYGAYGLNNVDSSMYYAKLAYTIAVEKNIGVYKTMASRILLENYILIGNAGQATFYLNELLNAYDLMTAEEMQIRSSLANVELVLRESELELAAKQRQNLIIIISFTITFLLFGGFTFLLFRKNKKQEALMKEIEDNNRLIQEQNAELASLNHEKDKFFSIIAHDLRNPFANVVGLASLIDTEVETTANQNLVEFSKLISESSKQAMDLLTNLMTWARSQTGKIAYQPRDVDLEALAAEEMEVLKIPASQKGIQLQTDVEPGLTLQADPYMLRTIVRNLLSNALKFTYPKGSVTLKAKAKAKEVELIVEDNGMGMTQEMADNLFKMKSEYQRQGTQGEPSTGLGLLICKEFVSLHKGQITVNAREGKGTVFHIVLPAAVNATDPIDASPS